MWKLKREVPEYGIPNPGVHCYLNTAIQCVAAMRSLNRRIYRGAEEGVGAGLLGEYSRILKNLIQIVKDRKDTENILVKYNKFKNIFFSGNTTIKDNVQEDCSEALFYILNKFCDEDKTLRKELFFNEKTFLKCNACGKKETKKEKNLFLNLSLLSNGMRKEEVHIKELVQEYTKENIAKDYKCEQCKSINTTLKKVFLFRCGTKGAVRGTKGAVRGTKGAVRVPKNFIMFFGRGASGGVRINKEIIIPYEMTLVGNRYILSALVLHHGNSATSGHYTCHVRRGKDWYIINDAQVSESAGGSGNENIIKTREAYVAIYSLT